MKEIYEELKDKYVHILTNCGLSNDFSFPIIRISGKLVNVEDGVLILEKTRYHMTINHDAQYDKAEFDITEYGRTATLDDKCFVELENVISIRKINIKQE